MNYGFVGTTFLYVNNIYYSIGRKILMSEIDSVCIFSPIKMFLKSYKIIQKIQNSLTLIPSMTCRLLRKNQALVFVKPSQTGD